MRTGGPDAGLARAAVDRLDEAEASYASGRLPRIEDLMAPFLGESAVSCLGFESMLHLDLDWRRRLEIDPRPEALHDPLSGRPPSGQHSRGLPRPAAATPARPVLDGRGSPAEPSGPGRAAGFPVEARSRASGRARRPGKASVQQADRVAGAARANETPDLKAWLADVHDPAVARGAAHGLARPNPAKEMPRPPLRSRFVGRCFRTWNTEC